jgi:hypothetical protein
MSNSKIWEFGGCLYTTEKGFKQAIEYYLKSKYYNNLTTYRVFELSETNTISDYKRQKEADERDKGIRSLLGELTKEEKLEIELKAKLSILIEVIDKLNISCHMVNFIKDNINKTKKILRFIKENKSYFLSLSNNIDYYKALLSIHNFKELSRKESYWDHTLSKFITIERLHLDKSYHDAFNTAKLELKKKK